MSLVEGLCRTYDGFKIDIPKWEIADQGVTALSGPSGSGKTTIFRMLIGLEVCPGLKWTLKGENLAEQPVGERRLGVVFQSLELFPHLSAEENILFAARARRLDSATATIRLNELTQDLQMSAFLKRPAAVLSGGEAQRVALARALIGDPRFLFLDEPFSSLDVELRSGARALVGRVLERLNIPTLLITHDPDDIRVLASRTVQLRNGHFV